MAVQNSDGTYNLTFEVKGVDLSLANPGQVQARIRGLNINTLFQKLTVDQIIQEIPDMSTLIEVYNKAEKALLEAKVA
jgi:hypothetical protein